MAKLPLGTTIQDLIHKLEVGAGARFLKWGLLALAVLFLVFLYNWRAYRNMAVPEAMDTAQLARNLADGQGFSTLFIRPLSIHLLTNHNVAEMSVIAQGQMPDPARLRDGHPDLANPPVYPLVLAALLKVLPIPYEIPGSSPETQDAKANFWNKSGNFWWYPPDFFIALFNQMLLLLVAVLTFFLARRLFDNRVAWMSALLVLATELLWRFSVSGLSTMLLMVLFLLLLWTLALLEWAVRENQWGARGPLLLAAAAGGLVGLSTLTRYSLGFLIIPVIGYIALIAGSRRIVAAVVALLVFLALLTPWVARNYAVCGKPFGTAGYALFEGSPAFSEYRLQRSLAPDLNRFGFGQFWYKLNTNTRRIVSNDLPRLGGSWVTALFLAGLLLHFNSPAINRLRYFVLFSLATLLVAQALGRTQLSEDSPELTTENLLVLLTSVVIIYGVSLFFVLLDQLELPIPELKKLIVGAFAIIMSLPLLMIFLPPRAYAAVVWPPYLPPKIQEFSGWMKDNELMMSDIPWAVAWYGKRQCVWFTLKATHNPRDTESGEDFFAISDYMKPVKALYLSPQTMDSRFLSDWVWAGEYSWGNFIFLVIRNELPPTFPLRRVPTGYWPQHLFLSDWDRWNRP